MDPVIIAGAGPTGLTLALCLLRHEVPVVLIDEGTGAAEAQPERTVVLRPRTADMLTRLGHPRMHEDSARWTGWRTLRRRQEVEHARFAPAAPSDTPDPGAALLPARRPPAPEPERTAVPAGKRNAPAPAGDAVPPLHLSQDHLRRGLFAALRDRDLLTVVRGARVDAVEQDAYGVDVHTDAQDGTQTWWRGSYLVGCDGPRSTVRKLLGIRFPGRTAVDRHAVAAVRANLPEPGVALLHRDPTGGRGTEVVARPLPRGVWRIDWSLRPDTPPLTTDTLIARIRTTLAGWSSGVVPAYELLGSAEYPVHQRLARRWRDGRAFLAGDAAHLLGTLGMQGTEEGLRDAENLAWKLALAWHQGASETLLDSYESERRGAVGSRLRAADQALPLLRAEGALHTLRQSVLPGAARRRAQVLTDGHLGRGPLGEPPVYRGSPLSLDAVRDGGRGGASPLVTPVGTAPGALVEDIAVIDLAGERALLSDRLGHGLLVVLVAPGTGVWESRHWLTAGLMPQLSDAVDGLPAPADLLITEAYPGATAHTVLLIRPDGHLVAAMTGCRPAELYAYADLARGGPPAPPPEPASAPDATADDIVRYHHVDG